MALSFERKKEIIKNVKDEIARVGSSNLHQQVHTYSLMNNIFYDSKDIMDLVGMITQGNEYIYDTIDRAFIVFRNPNYKQEKWNETHPVLYAIIVAMLSAILSLVVGLILWQVDKQSKHQEQQELLQKIQDVNKRFDSLTKIQKHK